MNIHEYPLISTNFHEYLPLISIDLASVRNPQKAFSVEAIQAQADAAKASGAGPVMGGKYMASLKPQKTNIVYTPINTIFSGMNIHLPAILMFTRGTRFWHTAI